MKGMERLSLKRLSAEGFFTGDPGICVKKGSGYENLSPLGPLSVLGELGIRSGARIPGTLNDE